MLSHDKARGWVSRRALKIEIAVRALRTDYIYGAPPLGRPTKQSAARRRLHRASDAGFRPAYRPKSRPIRWADLSYDEREAWGATLQVLVREGALPEWGAEPLELVHLAGVDAPQHRLTISDLDILLWRAAEILGVARR